MRGLLDDDILNGPYEVQLTYRPERVAIPVPADGVAFALETIRGQCQIWGGATTPLVPLGPDGTVPSVYRRILKGSAIDGFRGLKGLDLGSSEEWQPEVTVQEGSWWGAQFAAALLDYRRQETYAVLETVELAEGDPWRPIYAACLGLLPLDPSPDLLTACFLIPELRFEDFFRVDRVQISGSLEDLVGRLTRPDRLTPRRLSMIHLAYGNGGSTALRDKPRVLSIAGFARYDAGPNVIVLCSPGSLEDMALLWNLRGACGDGRPLPIGIPVDDATPTAIQELISHPGIARNGIAHRLAYVTSASLDSATIGERIEGLARGPRPSLSVASLAEMLTFGRPGGWHRSDVLVWRNGRARVAPLPADSHGEVFQRPGMNDLTRMAYDLAVVSHPFPLADDVRIRAMNETFAAGCWTASGQSARTRSEVQDVEWPSTSLIARGIARHRGIELAESEPGRACRVLLTGMTDLFDVSYLAHAPLLALLELMATRHGFGWYKERMRAQGKEVNPNSAVAPTADDLPDRSFGDFKKVLGDNERATKSWLLWAEKAGLILKGFPLQCVKCHAKQWIPVIGFSPPIICRGCGAPMDTPFGDRPTVNFMYRLSERLRRVYEQDSIGHLLVVHYFDSLFERPKSGRLVGMHPGMEVRHQNSPSAIGEADVLVLTQEAEFIPVEVKRRGAGLTGSEVGKLDVLAVALKSPWSAVAACEYAADSDSDLSRLVLRRESDGTYERIVLTYDRLLDPAPFWSFSGDPFALVALTPDEISKREQDFVARLEGGVSDVNASWLEWHMLHRQVSLEGPGGPGQAASSDLPLENTI